MGKKIGITPDTILDVAQGLLQTRGYNGFSYRDIAGAVGIRTASLHYHFPSKADLGVALAARYRLRFNEALEDITGQTDDARRRLERYADLFRKTLGVDGRLCLCGMLGAEIATLPDPVMAEVNGFFRDNEAWLTDIISAGQNDGTLHSDTPAVDQARLVLAALEGAMIVARATGDGGRFDAVAGAVLGQMEARI